MNARRILYASLVLFALLALAAPAWAGGWAVVTLDTLPTQVAAGRPFTIGFVVRQHGVRPMEGLAPQIIARRAEAAEALTVIARPQGEIGHYQATLTFPSTGTWSWTIDAFGAFPQPMPALTVLAPANSPRPAPTSLPMMVGFLSLLATAGALFLVARTRAAWAAALALAAILVCVVSFASAANHSAQAASDSPSSSTSQAEVGRALFLAKGCIVCHSHDAVLDARQDFADFSIGPNLSNVSRSPEYLRVWLTDPTLLKPDTQMPNLKLSREEIEALIAFLKSGAGQ